MFCQKCGTEADAGSNFCTKCGNAFNSPALSNTPSTSKQGGLTPSFGVPINRWWGPFHARKFPPGYEWMGERNTLLICSNHLVLLRGDEKRSSALDIIESMGLVGAAVASVRSVFDSVFVKKIFDLTSTIGTKLFEERQMVWCNKADAQVWQYIEKPWLLIKSSSEQLYCPFKSLDGVVHTCFVLWCTAEYTGQGKGDIPGIGCKTIIVAQNLKEKDVPEAMKASRMKLP